MPDVMRALSMGDDYDPLKDLSSEEGWDAALRAKVAGKGEAEPSAAAEPPAAEAPTPPAESPTQPRDEEGRFTPPSPVTPPEEGPAQPEEGTTTLELDEATSAWLEQQGGLEKALQAARERESLMGRQGNELGAARAQIEAQEARLAALEQRATQPQQPQQFPAPQTWGEDVVEHAVETYGFRDAAIAALQEAPHIRPENNRNYQAILDYHSDKGGAQARQAYRLEAWVESRVAELEAADAGGEQAASDPNSDWVEGQRKVEAATERVARIAAENPALADYRTAESRKVFTATLESLPDGLRESVSQKLVGDDELDTNIALEFLAARAKADGLATAGSVAATQAAAEQTARRQVVTVASGSLSPTGSQPAEKKSVSDMTPEEKAIALQEWKDSVFSGIDKTSVMANLEIGNATR